MRIYQSSSSEETKKLAERLAKGKWRRANGKAAVVFALSGELGSGKTTFIQGFLRGLGVRRRSPSPTFILFRRFALPAAAKASAGRRDSRFADLYHVDAYRIKNPRELLALGFREVVSDPKNIVLVEWADRIAKVLPRGAIRIKFSHGEKENERSIVVKR